MNLQDALNAYVIDQENPETNWNLAECYWDLGQTASSLSYHLRCAERSTDDNLAYECLLKVALAFQRPGNRNNSVRRMLQRAMDFMPKRPEAYFLLSRNYEMCGDWVDGYLFAKLGLELCDFNLAPLRSYVDYPGQYGLWFERAVCGWYWGREAEARKIFIDLVAKSKDSPMEEAHKNAVRNNIMALGHGPHDKNIRPYKKEMLPRLRHIFPGVENITENWAAVYQDIFVLMMLNGKTNGFFLEIGAARPYFGNNTALLEKLGWNGIGIEYNQEFANEWAKERKNPCLCKNALDINYGKLLDNNHIRIVDYLQLDLEPTNITYAALEKIPFDTHKFRVITYEHDHYCDLDHCFRDKSRALLSSHGYKMIVNDISVDGVHSFEDWWYHPDLVDPEIVKKMECLNDTVKEAEAYILGAV